MKGSLHKRDLIFLALIIVIGAVGMAVWFFSTRSDAACAVITVNGEEYGSYSLSDDQVIEIEDEDGHVTNIAVIENGEVYMKEADCPDQLCVDQGKKSRDGASIVCLPNKVVITVENADDSEEESIDTVVQ